MPADDRQLGEVERDLVDVGDRSAGLRGTHRAGVAHLGAERHPELDAGRIQRVVAAIRGRRLPQPGNHAQPDESELRRRSAAALERHPSAWPGSRPRGPRSDPGASRPSRRPRHWRSTDRPEPCHALSRPNEIPAASIAAIVTSIGSSSARDLLPRPAPKRLEHLLSQEPQRRVLHPDVDRHPAHSPRSHHPLGSIPRSTPPASGCCPSPARIRARGSASAPDPSAR